MTERNVVLTRDDSGTLVGLGNAPFSVLAYVEATDGYFCGDKRGHLARCTGRFKEDCPDWYWRDGPAVVRIADCLAPLRYEIPEECAFDSESIRPVTHRFYDGWGLYCGFGPKTETWVVGEVVNPPDNWFGGTQS